MELPSDRLDGRHALVTGAGRGLGRAVALALAANGAAITAVARSGDELDSLVAEIEAFGGQAWGRSADVTDEAAIEAAVVAADAVLPLGVVVTAAGLNRTGATADYATADWDLLMDVNVRGTFLAVRAVGRRMLAHGAGGRIVTMSSQMGSVGFPGRAAYCATKHAVNGLTKALAVEWAPAGITVNAVAPTFVETPMTRPMFENPDFAAEVRARIPGGEIAQLDDVAGAVLYLASDRGAAVSGHILAVDRGWTAW